MERLDGLDLPSYHPLAGMSAYQCPDCQGISYSGGAECPYCTDEDEDGDD